ncbi:MAG: hypothetical protein JO352_12100 [Chloroflexi bacterium]|nr:hypothetical protein [Chloroflexota bacterium]MBV9595955.1 hypothetical protein [Chloroflexota bacterium]
MTSYDTHAMRSPAGRAIRIRRTATDREVSYPREILRSLRRELTAFAVVVLLRLMG